MARTKRTLGDSKESDTTTPAAGDPSTSDTTTTASAEKESSPPSKKKSDGSKSVCSRDCGRPVFDTAWDTRPSDVCCNSCPNDHQQYCDCNYYRWKASIGEEIAMEKASDLNRKIKQVTNDEIRPVLIESVPPHFSQIVGLMDLLMEYCVSEVPVKPVWVYNYIEGKGDMSASKCGGRPQLKLDEEWPQCRLDGCGKLMPLYWQVNFDSLPAELLNDPRLFPRGYSSKLKGKLMQFFFCMECWETEHFSDGQLCRMVNVIQDESMMRDEQYCDNKIEEMKEAGIHESHEMITTQVTLLDPSEWEIPALGYIEEVEDYDESTVVLVDPMTNLPLNEDEKNDTRVVKIPDGIMDDQLRWFQQGEFDSFFPDIIQLDSDSLGAGFTVLSDEVYPSSRNKFGGWPEWIEDKDIPDCPDCNLKMTVFLGQFDAQMIGETFSDCGVGYFHLCPLCASVVAFTCQSS